MSDNTYYSKHRAEVLASVKARREANLQYYRDYSRRAQKRFYDSNSERCRKLGREYNKVWRDSNHDKRLLMKTAQQCVPLGKCCEFCDSELNLTRFILDSHYPKVVLTVCRQCRIWIKK